MLCYWTTGICDLSTNYEGKLNMVNSPVIVVKCLLFEEHLYIQTISIIVQFYLKPTTGVEFVWYPTA